MKNYKYTGIFKSADGHTYELEVYCNGFLQAFFLLTAKAIQTGNHYQLHTIQDEKDNIRYIDDIIKAGELISEKTI